MTSGPCIVIALEGADAVKKLRDLMGATNPANAAAGTVRHAFGQNVQENAVHGSDSPENAIKEIVFFFSEIEIVG
jgi:nucleoside-diphosphate kinase